MVPDFPEVPLRAVRTEKYLDTRMLLLPLAMACVMQRQWHVADKLLQTILLRSCMLETHHAPKHVLQDANKDYHYELLINIYIYKMFPVVNILSIRSFMQISYLCFRNILATDSGSISGSRCKKRMLRIKCDPVWNAREMVQVFVLNQSIWNFKARYWRSCKYDNICQCTHGKFVFYFF